MTEEEGRERERERRRRRWGKVRRGKHLGRGRTRREEEPQAELARPLSLSLHPSSQIPGPLRVASLVSSWLLSAFLCAPALVSFRAFLLERRPKKKKKKKQKSVSYQQSGKPWTGHTVKTGIVQLVWFHYSGRNVANEQTNNHQEKTFPLLIFFPPDWTTYWLEILSLSLDLATQTGHSGKWSHIVSLLHRRDLGANRNEKFGRRKGTQLAFSGYLCTYLVYCMRLKVTVEWLKEAKTVLESRILSSVHPKRQFFVFFFLFWLKRRRLFKIAGLSPRCCSAPWPLFAGVSISSTGLSSISRIRFVCSFGSGPNRCGRDSIRKKHNNRRF